eukprot:6071655-Prymnesium_polylepis.2
MSPNADRKSAIESGRNSRLRSWYASRRTQSRPTCAPPAAGLPLSDASTATPLHPRRIIHSTCDTLAARKPASRGRTSLLDSTSTVSECPLETL